MHVAATMWLQLKSLQLNRCNSNAATKEQLEVLRGIPEKRGRACNDPDFPALLAARAVEYKHVAFENTILRNSPQPYRKVRKKQAFGASAV